MAAVERHESHQQPAIRAVEASLPDKHFYGSAIQRIDVELRKAEEQINDLDRQIQNLLTSKRNIESTHARLTVLKIGARQAYRTLEDAGT